MKTDTKRPPLPETELELLDKFAGLAMQATITKGFGNCPEVAHYAYKMAKAMLIARARHLENPNGNLPQ